MNKLSKLVNSIQFDLDESEKKELDKQVRKLIRELSKNLKQYKMKAIPFVGGSYSKGTIIKKRAYDIDVFIRFDKKYFESQYLKLNDVTKKVAEVFGGKWEKVHGSRDYYRIILDDKIIFEIIPVIKIRKPEETDNVIDLSYFHVNYMKKKLTKSMQKEVKIAKVFLSSNELYGAESYIQGFSGYSLECLMLKYKSFYKMLQELTKKNEKIFIDYEKYYKNKNEAFVNMNESKIQGPLIVIDPTWKSRNVTAALSFETFIKFQEVARDFIRKPKVSYFIKKKFSLEDLQEFCKEMKAEIVKIKIHTSKQEGDIAGTKMKKAFKFITKQIEKQFNVLRKYFIYNSGKTAEIYIAAKSKRAITINGPPVKMQKSVDAFKGKHKRVFNKSGKLYAIEPVSEDLKEHIKKEFLNSKELNSMSITKIEVI